MKKLFFFFSTLFFILVPHVSADSTPPLYIDYRDSSVTPYIVSSVNAIKDTICASPECNDLSQDVGHSVSVYEYTENMIEQFENAGYKFVVTAGWNPTNNYYGVNRFNYPSFTYYVINTNETSLSDLSINLEYDSSSNKYLYRLKDGNDINVFGWSGSDLLDVERNRDILGYEANFQSILFTFDGDNDYDLTGSPILYYSNIDLPYNFTYDGSDYPITVFSDWFGSEDSVSISTGHGPATNKYLMLRSFIEEDNFFPPDEPDIDPDNPNQGIEDGLGDLNDSINSSDISGSEGAFNDFFGNFESDDHGLFAIISTPLNFIKSFLNSVCTPLVLPLPFVDTDVTLPCMEYVYTKFFGNFFTAYQTITTGIVAYWVCINILRTVKDMKDSEKDTIEVLDL